jgi:hypothetical protein
VVHELSLGLYRPQSDFSSGERKKIHVPVFCACCVIGCPVGRMFDRRHQPGTRTLHAFGDIPQGIGDTRALRRELRLHRGDRRQSIALATRFMPNVAQNCFADVHRGGDVPMDTLSWRTIPKRGGLRVSPCRPVRQSAAVYPHQLLCLQSRNQFAPCAKLNWGMLKACIAIHDDTVQARHAVWQSAPLRFFLDSIVRKP